MAQVEINVLDLILSR